MTTELARLKDEVSYKDSVIRKLQGWREADVAVMGGEDGMADVMEEQRAKFQAVHDQESKEMADAAYQTIKTLNEMLEQKKVQLRAKEEHIDKLRQQMAEQRELAAEQYMELQSKATATGKSALANLHRLAANQEASAAGAERQSPEARRQAARSEAEFQKTQQELTRLSALVLEQQDALEQLRSQLEAE